MSGAQRPISRLRHLLRSALERVEEPEREVTIDGSLTHSRAAVLAAIPHVGRKYGVSGIARMLGLARPNVSRTVADLDEMGFIVRVQRVGSDVHSILLSEDGIAALAALDSFHVYVEEEALAPLSEEERQVLVALLAKLAGFEVLEMAGEQAGVESVASEQEEREKAACAK